MYVSVKVTVSESESDSAEQTRNESKAFQVPRNGDQRHSGKRFVVHLLDKFIINGSNGRHQCFVLPVALNGVNLARQFAVPTPTCSKYRNPGITCGIVHSLLWHYTRCYVDQFHVDSLLTIDNSQIDILKTFKRHLQLYDHSRSPMRKSDMKNNYMMVRLSDSTLPNTKLRPQVPSLPAIALLRMSRYMSQISGKRFSINH